MDTVKQKRLFALAISEIVCGAVFLLLAILGSVFSATSVQVVKSDDAFEITNETSTETPVFQTFALPSSVLVVVSILHYLFPVLVLISGVLGVIFVKKSLNSIMFCRNCLNILLSIIMILLYITFFICLIVFVIVNVVLALLNLFILCLVYFFLTLFMSITLILDLALCHQKNGEAEYRSLIQTQDTNA